MFLLNDTSFLSDLMVLTPASRAESIHAALPCRAQKEMPSSIRRKNRHAFFPPYSRGWQVFTTLCGFCHHQTLIKRKSPRFVSAMSKKTRFLNRFRGRPPSTTDFYAGGVLSRRGAGCSLKTKCLGLPHRWQIPAGGRKEAADAKLEKSGCFSLI